MNTVELHSRPQGDRRANTFCTRLPFQRGKSRRLWSEIAHEDHPSVCSLILLSVMCFDCRTETSFTPDGEANIFLILYSLFWIFFFMCLYVKSLIHMTKNVHLHNACSSRWGLASRELFSCATETLMLDINCKCCNRILIYLLRLWF